MKFYIAFSIHGTNNFKVLTKEAPNLEALGLGFTAAFSRRADYNQAKDGIKVHWNKLMTKKGQPLRSVGLLSTRCKELVGMGWTQVK